MATEPTVFYFDRFCLDTVKGLLTDSGGSTIDLRPKSFALLLLLVKNPDRLYGREELLQTLWPDVVVSDDSLTQCMSDLRRAFGARASQILRTVPRRGYVFTATVRSEIPKRAAPTTPILQVAASEITACLVLESFASPSAGRDTELARALTADLLTELAKFEGVRVSATAQGQVAGSYRIQGELRISGNKLHIAVRLEDAVDGAAVWADVVERPAADGPEIPEGVVELLAAAIVRQADREDLRRARLKAHADLTVRELCLIGRDHHQRGTRDDTLIALSMFERAIARAPDVALPHSWQAYTIHRVITHKWGPAIDEQTARDRALMHARRAVQLEPESALCLSRLAFILMLHRRWDEALETARAALQIARPADYASRNTCCEVLAHGGDPVAASDAVRRALSLDPHCPPTTRSLLGRALLMAGDPEAALPELRWCAARLPDYVPCFHSIIVAAFETGRVEEAQSAWREAVRLQPNWLPENHTGSWFFRNDQDAERFKTAFRGAGWHDLGKPEGQMPENSVRAKDASSSSAFVTSPSRTGSDLRDTKPLGNA